MPNTINSSRFINSGTIRGGFVMGDGKNYVDTTQGLIYGKVSMLAGSDTFLGGRLSEVVDGGDGSDKLIGGLGNDRLIGGAGGDRLDGGVGNDQLIGGAGKDILMGGSGTDSFVFNVQPDAAVPDVIRDFSSADDTIRISRSIFTEISHKGKLDANAFHLGAKAADAHDRVIYHKASGSLFYDPDGTGPAAQIKLAVLSNKAALALSDFLVI